MSNANHETIADIVADIRAQNQGLPEDSYALSPLVCDLLSFADRIEAAANREREAGAEAAQVCGEIGEMIGREATREKSSRVGNAAKMREALEEIVDMATCYFPDFTIPKDDDEFRGAIIDEAIDYTSLRDDFIKAVIIARDAISAPPRNCDVGTDEEQSRRYEELCDRHTCGSRCSASGCPMYEHDCSPFAWGQMPYEEGGAK